MAWARGPKTKVNMRKTAKTKFNSETENVWWAKTHWMKLMKPKNVTFIERKAKTVTFIICKRHFKDVCEHRCIN